MQNTNSLSVSAVVPCYNHWDTVGLTIESILKQSVSVDEIFLIDDCSSSTCPDSILDLSIRIKLIRNKKNMGRGYCRNIGVNLCKADYILMVDSTNSIESDFIKKSLKYFEDDNIAAVSGTLRSVNLDNTLLRWRSRHLFKEDKIGNSMEKSTMLITYGTLMSKSAIMKCGGFNPCLKYKEDQDLGSKFEVNELYVIGDPNIAVYSLRVNSLWEVLERYCRWNMDINEKPSFIGYLKNIKASLKPMIQSDLKNGDYKAIFISLLVPHFQLYYSVKTFLKEIS